MVPTIFIPQLHLEYQLWYNQLTFYKEEIRIFEHHLEEIISRCQSKESLAQVEHFQNQFICQKEVIDILKHDLNVSERQLAGFVKNLSGLGIESIRMDNHVNLRERTKIFRKVFRTLKDEFRQFAKKFAATGK